MRADESRKVGHGRRFEIQTDKLYISFITIKVYPASGPLQVGNKNLLKLIPLSILHVNNLKLSRHIHWRIDWKKVVSETAHIAIAW